MLAHEIPTVYDSMKISDRFDLDNELTNTQTRALPNIRNKFICQKVCVSVYGFQIATFLAV